MTHDELLAICDNYSFKDSAEPVKALRAVVELHKNNGSKYTLGYGQVAIELCEYCRETYPCQTIQAIEKELR
jgi:hypothetical protein